MPGTRLAQLYPGAPRFTVNSVHHQGIKDLAGDFVVEAVCPDDGVIEAIRWRGPATWPRCSGTPSSTSRPNTA